MNTQNVQDYRHGIRQFPTESAAAATRHLKSHEGTRMDSIFATKPDAFSKSAIIPILLRCLSDIAGLNLAAIIRTDGGAGIVFAVEDRITAAVAPMDRFAKTTRQYLSEWVESGSVPESSGESAAAGSNGHDVFHGDNSCICASIVLPGGRLFGKLFARTSTNTDAAHAQATRLLRLFACQIGLAINNELLEARAEADRIEARASTELTEQFVAILGHDLRNPLQAISVIGELLERQLTDPHLVNLTSRMRQSTRRMSALIDDILDFARIRLGGGLGVEIRETHNLDDALLAIARELQDGHPDRRIVASVHINRTVRCDAGRLQQLVSNLLGNALTHGFRDGTVRFTASADESYLALEVWNDGEPIPADALDHLFMPFWRNKLESHRAGLGLGLHICSQIVRAHGGFVTVSSERKAGTKFTVRLPLQAESPSAPAARFA